MNTTYKLDRLTSDIEDIRKIRFLAQAAQSKDWRNAG
jgi:hypothetical protein